MRENVIEGTFPFEVRYPLYPFSCSTVIRSLCAPTHSIQSQLAQAEHQKGDFFTQHQIQYTLALVERYRGRVIDQ